MTLPSLRASILLLFSLAFSADTAFGQSLSIIKEGENQLSIEASAPGGTRYALQVSKDLNLWLDVNDAVSGAVSNRVGSPGATERYFRLIPWAEPAPIRIVLLGDSTVADLDSNFGHFYGWGHGMPGYFKANAQVLNLAYPGVGHKKLPLFRPEDPDARD
jgi:hypothetical protein